MISFARRDILKALPDDFEPASAIHGRMGCWSAGRVKSILLRLAAEGVVEMKKEPDGNGVINLYRKPRR